MKMSYSYTQRAVAAFGFAASVLMLVPMLAFAQSPEFGALGTFADSVTGFINGVLIPLIFAIALLVFIWGMFTYFILGGGDEGKREQGKGLMLYAILGFVMMIIIFGIVNLIANGLLSGLGEDNDNIDDLPSINNVNPAG
jgi:hypothetical protein